MYYKLIYKENPDVELICCVDMDTIDDDEVDCEWMQNTGLWDTQVPHYWKVDGVDLTYELEELFATSVSEWDYISQALVDCENEEGVFVHNFEKCILLVSEDGEFAEYYLQMKKSTIQIDGFVKKELDSLKVHERQSYNEVIASLIKNIKGGN